MQRIALNRARTLAITFIVIGAMWTLLATALVSADAALAAARAGVFIRDGSAASPAS